MQPAMLGYEEQHEAACHAPLLVAEPRA
jgi:hypothetical protein